MTLQPTLLVGLISALLHVPVANANIVEFAKDDAKENSRPLNDFFQTESVFNQDRGEWQVKLGADFDKNDDAHTTTLHTGLEYGITDSLQVELDHTPYVRIKPQDDTAETVDGQGNTSIGLKKNWMHIGDSANSVAVGYEHEFANGNEDISGDDAKDKDSDDIYITAAHDLSKSGNTQATLQVGTERSNGANETYANLAAFHATGKQVWVGEYNWSEAESWLTPGVFWKPHKGLDLGVGVGIGVNNTDGHRVMTRLNYEWD